MQENNNYQTELINSFENESNGAVKFAASLLNSEPDINDTELIRLSDNSLLYLF